MPRPVDFESISSKPLQRWLADKGRGAKAELARKLNISPQLLTQWLARGTIPVASVERVAAHIGLDETSYRKMAGAKHRAADRPDLALVPFYDSLISAGRGNLVVDEKAGEPLAFRRAWLRRLGLHESSLQVATVRGDSMKPALFDKDIILVDREARQRKLASGAIYTFVFEGESYVKRLLELPDGWLRVHSDNPHPDFRLPDVSPERRTAFMDITGRVVWRGGGVE